MLSLVLLLLLLVVGSKLNSMFDSLLMLRSGSSGKERGGGLLHEVRGPVARMRGADAEGENWEDGRGGGEAETEAEIEEADAANGIIAIGATITCAVVACCCCCCCCICLSPFAAALRNPTDLVSGEVGCMVLASAKGGNPAFAELNVELDAERGNRRGTLGGVNEEGAREE